MKFVSNNPKTKQFLEMARLLSFLESTESKDAKIKEIKAARTNGLINQDEAIDLTIEFC